MAGRLRPTWFGPGPGPGPGSRTVLCRLQAAAGVFSADAPISSGPIISDITEVVQPIVEEDVSDWTVGE